MDVTLNSQISSMAASANDAVGTTMLRKALDQQASSAAQLLQSLPQKDGAGQLIDVQL